MALGRRLDGRRTGLRGVDASLAIVNIVLLLIFFFMMAGSFSRPQELAFDPATTASLRLERLPRPLLVLASAEDWRLDGVAFAPGLLASQLGMDPPARLYVLAAAGLPAQVLAALGARPELARTELLLVTLHRSGPRAGAPAPPLEAGP